MNLPDNFIEARKLLVRSWPFYGVPALQTPVEMDERIPTAGTDGRVIKFNPKFIHRMPVPHLAAVIAHECVHILRADPDMLATKRWPDGTPITNLRKANRAMDFWINQSLVDDTFQLPPLQGICLDAKYRGMTVRQIYNLLPDELGDGTGEGEQGMGGFGDDVIGTPMTEEERVNHTIQVRQAYEAAKGQGRMPGWADKFVEKIRTPRIQFRDLLEAWLHDTFSKEDISYRRLNRHYLPDFFVPTTSGLSFGRLDIFMDTSGSCWDDAPLFLGLVNKALRQLRPVDTYLYMFDDGLKGTPIRFKPGETLDIPSFKVVGNGGTNFAPCFDYIRANRVPTDAVIMMTDMMGTFPSYRPNHPTLWVSTIPIEQITAPFGKQYYVHQGDEEDE